MELILFWFQIGFGLLIILILITLGIQTSKEKKKIMDDEKTFQIVKSELAKDGHDYFELESIISLDKPHVISVIVNTGFLQIGLEIDNKKVKF